MPLRRLPVLFFLVPSLIALAPAHAQTVVRVAPFRSVALEGGGHVVLRNGNVQQVRLLKGDPALTRFRVRDDGQLRIEACNDNCPSRYDLEIEITTPAIDALAISGGGAIDVSGGLPCRPGFALAVDGGGTIDSRAMRCAQATVAVNGGGVVRVSAAHRLTAAVHGGGTIKYWGNPELTQAIDGGGEVKQGR